MGGADPTSAGILDCDTQGRTLRLALEGVIEAVESGQQRLGAFLAGLGLDDRSIHRVEVVFEEVVSNVIRHGMTAGSGQSLRVRANVDSEAVELVVEDDAAPFDPLAAPAPVRPANLAEARPGGLGVALVRRMAESVRYEREPATSEAGFAPINRLTVRMAAAPP